MELHNPTSRHPRWSGYLLTDPYRVYEAEGQLSEPVWPGKPLPELLKLGFKDRIIDSPDHPVIKRLRGLS